MPALGLKKAAMLGFLYTAEVSAPEYFMLLMAGVTACHCSSWPLKGALRACRALQAQGSGVRAPAWSMLMPAWPGWLGRKQQRWQHA